MYTTNHWAYVYIYLNKYNLQDVYRGLNTWTVHIVSKQNLRQHYIIYTTYYDSLFPISYWSHRTMDDLCLHCMFVRPSVWQRDISWYTDIFSA